MADRLIRIVEDYFAALRVDNKGEFLQRFNDADAVQFFYEPFLEAFDPVLRKQLGVWYTPSEVVAYMVAGVDKALRETVAHKTPTCERLILSSPIQPYSIAPDALVWGRSSVGQSLHQLSTR